VNTEAASRRPRRWAGYLEALAAIVVATGLAAVMVSRVAPGTLTSVYLLAVVSVAARAGRGPAIAACLGSVGAFDFFFVPPRFTFAVADMQYWLTFGVMLVVGLLVGTLTARIRRQAEAARQRERWTTAGATMNAALSRAASADDLARVAQAQLVEHFGPELALLLPDGAGALRAVDPSDRFPADEGERAAAAWTFAKRRPAGRGTADVPDAPVRCLPVLGGSGALGVVVARASRHAAGEARAQLEGFVSRVALALEWRRLADEAQAARARMEAERLRNSLLTSVSHDLRTPLTAITGAATTLLESADRVDARTRTELLEAVRDEAERLNRLVHNLLEMTRLEAGALRVQREWHPLEEIVGAALGRLARRLGTRRVAVSIPPELPLVAVDDVLIEQVLVNLLDNAVKYTPLDSVLRLVVSASEAHVTLELADDGPGLPRGEEQRVFEKFHRAHSDAPQGAGLGLAICRGIVEAHGGRIWAQNLPERGVAFLFTLPLDGSRPSVPADA